MKKISSILVALFLFTSNSFATSAESPDHYRYSRSFDGETFNFVSGNVNFMVFKNGEFDFFIAHEGFTTSFDFGAVNITFNSGYNYNSYIQYDSFGAIIQIEDVPIFYDFFGRVNRIGNTHIQYHNRRISRFGGLHIHFNSYGRFDYYSGYINPFNRHFVYRPYFSFFARPHIDFCVVSYRPYRQYYRPIRTHFHRDNRYRRLDSRNHVDRNMRTRATRKTVPHRITRSTRDSSIRGNNTRTATTRNSRAVKPNTRSTSTRNSRAVKPNTRSTSTRNSRAVKPNTRSTSTRNSRAVKPNTRSTSTRNSRAVKPNTRSTSTRNSRAIKPNTRSTSTRNSRAVKPNIRSTQSVRSKSNKDSNSRSKSSSRNLRGR